MAELWKLSVLSSGMTDRHLACTFVVGLLDWEKQLLRVSPRMDTLTTDQLLDTIMKNKVMDLNSTVAAAQTVNERKEVLSESPCNNITYYKCNSSNHMAKDCLSNHKVNNKENQGRGQGPHKAMHYLCCQTVGHILCNCPGKDISASTFTAMNVNLALSVTEIQVHGKPCTHWLGLDMLQRKQGPRNSVL